MAFNVVVPVKSPAARALQLLQPPVRAAFWLHIRKLEPTADSRPISLADPRTRWQAYRFKIPLEGQTAYFTITFHFADTQDENTLVIASLDVTIV